MTTEELSEKKNSLPMTYNEQVSMSKVMFESGLFMSCKNAQQAFVTIQAGRELGIGPFESLSSIYVIHGRTAFYAHKYGDMIKRTDKYNYKVTEHTNEKCSIDFYESGELMGNSTFTMEDAKKAGLDTGDNWRKYPRNMLYARAITNGAKWHCPDAFKGGAYEPEELGATVEYQDDGTQVVLDVPNPKVSTQMEIPKEGEEVELEPAPHGVIQFALGDDPREHVTVTGVEKVTVKSFTELQSANGRPYAKVTFLEKFRVPGVEPRWDDYNVSPFVFEEAPDRYRSLEHGKEVFAKLTFEKKGDKNYQNCEIMLVVAQETEASEQQEEDQNELV